ncbi:uncharacterized protein [Typha angustifolia]|uniref:uncharacterized protein n=1 Tax=Typha angustifolia TaxID=59011 RepID=UPI003C302105
MMEVAVPIHEFHLNSGSTTPFVSAPSSPRPHFAEPFDLYCHYTSAPTSPTRAAAIYAHFTSLSSNSSSVPFDWEEKPGTPKSPSSPPAIQDDDDDDFAFALSGRLDKGGAIPELTAADELFEGGRIRPLKPPPRLQHPSMEDFSSVCSSPKSPKSPIYKGMWSPHRRGRGGRVRDDVDPFAVAMVEATKDKVVSSSSSSSRSRKVSRSLSPLRVGRENFNPIKSSNPTTPKSGGSKKWRLKDLLLFRSSSEGRATGSESKDPLLKYSPIYYSNAPSFAKKRGTVDKEDPRNASFRSVDSNGGSMRRSPHEKHYAASRAFSEELKKKTPLPYRQSLFGCFRFNPAIQSVARGFGGYSFRRGHSDR